MIILGSFLPWYSPVFTQFNQNRRLCDNDSLEMSDNFNALSLRTYRTKVQHMNYTYTTQDQWQRLSSKHNVYLKICHLYVPWPNFQDKSRGFPAWTYQQAMILPYQKIAEKYHRRTGTKKKYVRGCKFNIPPGKRLEQLKRKRRHFKQCAGQMEARVRKKLLINFWPWTESNAQNYVLKIQIHLYFLWCYDEIIFKF